MGRGKKKGKKDAQKVLRRVGAKRHSLEHSLGHFEPVSTTLMGSFGKGSLQKTLRNLLAWLPLQSLAVKKKDFFFLCKFWAVKNF